jgi:hypothetical protein
VKGEIVALEDQHWHETWAPWRVWRNDRLFVNAGGTAFAGKQALQLAVRKGTGVAGVRPVTGSRLVGLVGSPSVRKVDSICFSPTRLSLNAAGRLRPWLKTLVVRTLADKYPHAVERHLQQINAYRNP